MAVELKDILKLIYEGKVETAEELLHEWFVDKSKNIQKELCDEDRLFIKRSHQHFRTSVYFRQYKRCV